MTQNLRKFVSTHLPNMLRGAIVVIVIFAAIVVVERAVTPAPTATPDIGNGVVYIGYLNGTKDKAAGGVGLIVTSTQTRAVLCATDPVSWKAIDAWLPAGSNTNGALAANNAATGASLTGQIGGGTVTGVYTASNGDRFSYSATALPQGSKLGLFFNQFQKADAKFTGGGILRLIVYDTGGDVGQSAALCGLMMQGNENITRVTTQGLWNEGFSTFVLLDLKDASGQSVMLSAPGPLQHIVGIAGE
jgi:hypothetical protein